MKHIIQINNNFAACVQSVRHQHAYMISDCRAHGVRKKVAPLVNRSLDNVLFKVNPSLRQTFLQVIDVTNLCSVPALLCITPQIL